MYIPLRSFRSGAAPRLVPSVRRCERTRQPRHVVRGFARRIPLLVPGGSEILAAEHAVLILARPGCERCRAYERDLLARLDRGELPQVVVRKVFLDAQGAEAFRRSHPEPSPLAPLPYTLLFLEGKQVDGFSSASGAYLLERMEGALVLAPW